jgi:hypothetical protein
MSALLPHAGPTDSIVYRIARVLILVPPTRSFETFRGPVMISALSAYRMRGSTIRCRTVGSVVRMAGGGGDFITLYGCIIVSC